MADLCIHELHRCVVCVPEEGGERPPRMRPTMFARYAGTCGECGFGIQQGDPIGWVERTEGGRFVRAVVVHAGCAELRARMSAEASDAVEEWAARAREVAARRNADWRQHRATELGELSKTRLAEIARENSINVGKLTKAELVDAILDAEQIPF